MPGGPSQFSNAPAPNTTGSASLSRLAPSAVSNFDGISANGSAPPDDDGAAGPNQYVELVNTELAVYSKSGSVLLGPEATNTLWSGFGGGCQDNNDGDGTIVFDTLSQRWVIQQFSVSTTPYLLCVAVSASSDATGSWYRYSFQYANFPDYPKIAVWPDAYYASFNQFQGNTFLGAEMCAFNRSAMLTGASASQQCFTPSSAQGSVLPASLESSTPPPTGEPEWFVGISPSQANALAYWTFHVDWNTPANSTVTGPTNVPVNSFSEACAGGVCIPQPGTHQKLDSLGDRLMFPLAYRNFGDHEALVVSHAVVSGSSVGMRWYELRPSGGSLGVYQQGTYAPDSNYRWMGSIAMDHADDMGLGYSVSSSSVHPSVAYTGRLASDALGTMPQGETTLYSGPGSQTGGLNRWGDYSEMSVDPSDDCTFWYVNEYLPSNGSFNWHTRVGSFKFSGCNAQPGVTTGSASSVGLSSATVSGTVNPNDLRTTYHFDYGTSTSYGSQAPLPPDPSAGSGTTSQPVAASLTGLSPGMTYHYRLEATNSTGTTYGGDRTLTTAALTFTSSPAVSGGTVYVGSQDGKLDAFGAFCAIGGNSCSASWTAATGGPILSSPAVANGAVYVGSGDGKLYAFPTSCSGTCSPLWTGSTGAAIDSSPTVSGGVVYVGSEDGRLYAFPTSCSGACSPSWTGSTGGPVDSSPAVSGGVVYVGSQDHSLYAFPTSCSGACSPSWTGSTGGPVDSSPAVSGGVVYVGSQDHSLYAFPTSCSGTCSPSWTAATGGPIVSSAAVANGVVYVGSQDDKLYGFPASCSSSCSPLWTATTGGPIDSSPAVTGGAVYATSQDGNLYSYVLP